jgi:hypothetical protein
VLRRNRADGVAIAGHGREASFDRVAADIDDWQFRRRDRLFNLAVLDPRDNPMSMPIVEPGWGLISTTLLREMDFPIRSLSHVSSDSPQQPATVGVGSFDQERYLRALGGGVQVICHGWRMPTGIVFDSTGRVNKKENAERETRIAE